MREKWFLEHKTSVRVIKMCYQCETGVTHICSASGGVLVGNPASGYMMESPRNTSLADQFHAQKSWSGFDDDEEEVEPALEEKLTPRNARGAGIKTEVQLADITSLRLSTDSEDTDEDEEDAG